MQISDTVALRNGVLMPRLGLGTYKTAAGSEVVGAVEAALEAGVRSIDTASLYANESGVGEAIRNSGVPREQVFITTKVWNDDLGYRETAAAVRESIDLLGTDYVDLYLIHWPVREKMAGAWKAMEEAYDSGLLRAIGVSNFLPHHLDELAASARLTPMVNQFEFHPRLQQPRVVQECVDRGIVVESWRPLMQGRIVDVPEIMRIAEAHGKTPVQVTIRWVLQRGLVVIPKSSNPDRVRQNIEVFDFELDSEQMATMNGLDACERLGKDPDNFSF